MEVSELESVVINIAILFSRRHEPHFDATNITITMSSNKLNVTAKAIVSFLKIINDMMLQVHTIKGYKNSIN